MLTPTRLGLYIAFLMALGIWTGGGIHESLGSHFGWWANPVGSVRGAVRIEGAVNPWPFTTAALALCLLATAAGFARYRESGARGVWIVLAGVGLILVATATYFVPTLGRLGNHPALTDAQLIDMSRTWIQLNFVRTLVLLALFAYGLVTLVRLGRSRP